MSLYDLPKEMLIKLICEVEKEWKEKCEHAQKMEHLYEILTDSYRDDVYICVMCKELCMVKRDDGIGKKYVAVSNHEDAITPNQIKLQLNGQDGVGGVSFDTHGTLCKNCNTWFCSAHWESGVIETEIEGDHFTFCKNCFKE